MIGLAVLALPTILLALDMSVLYLALPTLGADLDASSVQQLWITDIYGFMVAGLLITMGTVGDRIGRRRLLLLGAAAFSVASVVAAYSTSAEMLIVTRALLGIAGATLMPSTLTLISNMFQDPKQHAMAIGVWMSCFMGGTALGPVVGGVMLEYFWWGSVFLLGVPIMALLLVLGPRLLPEFRNPDAGRIDLTSVALSLAAILPIIYGLKELSRDGAAVDSVLAIVVGALVGLVFLQRQRTLSDPLLDLKLFRNRTFSSALTMTVLAGVLAGTHLFVYMYLQLVEELSPLRTAMWMLPSTLLTVVSLMTAPLIARYVRPAYTMVGGLLIVVLGYVMLTRLDGDGGLAMLVGGLVLVALGIGPMAGLSASLVMGSVPLEKSGSAASLSETSGEFGLAMGVAVLGTVGTAVYRDRIADDIGPAIPAELADAAGESAAGAAAAIQQLSGPVAAELTRGMQDALAGALNGSAWVSAGLAAALCVLALTALRHVPPTGQTEGAEGERAEPAAAEPAPAE
jgi:DHA2 family multidrug resistance protein-like MFS transporter